MIFPCPHGFAHTGRLVKGRAQLARMLALYRFTRG